MLNKLSTFLDSQPPFKLPDTLIEKFGTRILGKEEKFKSRDLELLRIQGDFESNYICA